VKLKVHGMERHVTEATWRDVHRVPLCGVAQAEEAAVPIVAGGAGEGVAPEAKLLIRKSDQVKFESRAAFYCQDQTSQFKSVKSILPSNSS
jgi:hypothetical protein